MNEEDSGYWLVQWEIWTKYHIFKITSSSSSDGDVCSVITVEPENILEVKHNITFSA